MWSIRRIVNWSVWQKILVISSVVYMEITKLWKKLDWMNAYSMELSRDIIA